MNSNRGTVSADFSGEVESGCKEESFQEAQAGRSSTEQLRIARLVNRAQIDEYAYNLSTEGSGMVYSWERNVDSQNDETSPAPGSDCSYRPVAPSSPFCASLVLNIGSISHGQ